MCDSMVALPDVTQFGDLIFAKNSDRPDGEIQDVVRIPPRTYNSCFTIWACDRQLPKSDIMIG